MRNQKSLLVDSGDANDANEEWQGMPEFVQEKREPFCKIVVRFRNQADLEDFAAKIGQKLNVKSQSTWHPELKKGEIGNSGKKYVDES